MRTDELVVRCRRTAFIGDGGTYVDFTDAILLQEMTDRMRSVFTDSIISSRAGYWLTSIDVTVTGGTTRIPDRAAVGGLESVEWLSNGRYFHLDEKSPREAAAWSSPGNPVGYWSDGESITLVPTPPSTVTLRLRYYLLPSQMVTSQSSTAGGAFADRGRVTAIDPSTRTATVNALPFDIAGTGVAITSGTFVDIVRPAGWHTPTAVNMITSITGLNVFMIGFTVATFTAAVKVGDYIRVAGQTDWPPLPADYHRMLADATAAMVLREMHLYEEARTIGDAASADFSRFAKLINPRVKSEPKRIRQRPYWVR